MSRYVLLLSSAAIEHSAWRSFLQAAGAELVDKPHNPYDGRIVHGRDTIWLRMDNDQMEDIDAQEPGLVGRLGGEPRTLIVIEMANIPGSRALAEAFASRFAEHWPAVLEDVRDAGP